jgi:hypothetical protein
LRKQLATGFELFCVYQNAVSLLPMVPVAARYSVHLLQAGNFSLIDTLMAALEYTFRFRPRKFGKFAPSTTNWNAWIAFCALPPNVALCSSRPISDGSSLGGHFK